MAGVHARIIIATHTQLINKIISVGARPGESKSTNQRQRKVGMCQLLPVDTRTSDTALCSRSADKSSCCCRRSGSAAHRMPLWQLLLMAVVSRAKPCRTIWHCH